MKRKLKNRLLQHLFKAINEDKVLNFNNLSQVDIKRYSSEARFLHDLSLYQDLIKDLRHRANELIFIRSNSLEDLQFGKAMLFNIDIIEKTINKFKKL